MDGALEIMSATPDGDEHLIETTDVAQPGLSSPQTDGVPYVRFPEVMPLVVRRPQKAYSFVVLLALNLTTDAWADYETGIAAYKRGDYAAAAAEIKIDRKSVV